MGKTTDELRPSTGRTSTPHLTFFRGDCLTRPASPRHGVAPAHRCAAGDYRYDQLAGAGHRLHVLPSKTGCVPDCVPVSLPLTRFWLLLDSPGFARIRRLWEPFRRRGIKLISETGRSMTSHVARRRCRRIGRSISLAAAAAVCGVMGSRVDCSAAPPALYWDGNGATAGAGDESLGRLGRLAVLDDRSRRRERHGALQRRCDDDRRFLGGNQCDGEFHGSVEQPADGRRLELRRRERHAGGERAADAGERRGERRR